MKIKKFKKLSHNNEFIKLKTLKSYSKTKQTNTQKMLLQTHLIKICNIIYQYNSINKKILFIGFPNSYKSVLKKTKHKIIPDCLLFNGILTNKESINSIIKTKIKNIDLIVTHNQSDNLAIKKESDKTRIPIIAINDKQNLGNNTTYQLSNNYKSLKEKNTSNNLFLIFLKNTLIETK